MDIESKEFRENLGRKIKFFRKRLGFTQTELMEKLDYTSDGMISQIETGKRGMDITKIIKASKLFNIDVTVLVSDYDFNDEKLSIILGLFAVLKKGKKDAKYQRLKKLLT